MEKVRYLILVLLILTGCQTGSGENASVRGAIVPHHTLVAHEIDNFYAEIADDEARYVLLVSPNHYGFGYNFVQSGGEVGSAVDILGNQGVLTVEPRDFEKEHGIYVHLPYLQKYFPNAEVIPVTLKVGTPQSVLDDLIEGLLTFADVNGAYVIASIDFSHYVTEEVAQMNDQRTKTWMQEWEERKPEYGLADLEEIKKVIVPTSEDSVAIDSIESLYVILRLMEGVGAQDFDFWKRTSTTTVLGMNDPELNTSHLFVKFLSEN